jgi:hypothetical protein
VGLSSARTLQGSVDSIGGNDLPSIRALNRTKAAIISAQRDIRSAILVTNPTDVQKSLGDFKQDLADLDRELTSYGATPLSDTAKKLLADFQTARKEWQDVNEHAATAVATNSDEGDRTATELVMQSGAPKAQALNDTLTAMIGESQRQADA